MPGASLVPSIVQVVKTRGWREQLGAGARCVGQVITCLSCPTHAHLFSTTKVAGVSQSHEADPCSMRGGAPLPGRAAER